jgi:hypothetical protein
LDDPSVGGLKGDPDEDLLLNFQEFYFNTDPTNPDTDGDGQYDGVEVAVNSNPNGEGKLFLSDRERAFAEEFVQSNQLDELTEESITQTLGALLTSASFDEVEVPMIDMEFLNVSSDNSSAAALKYAAESKSISSGLGHLSLNMSPLLEDLDKQEMQITIGKFYETMDKMRELSVPTPFVTLHQLQLAAIGATAKMLEHLTAIDPDLNLEEQKDVTQNLSYQIQVIEKASQLIAGEMARLSGRYPELFGRTN